jgi:hypothetical protein
LGGVLSNERPLPRFVNLIGGTRAGVEFDAQRPATKDRPGIYPIIPGDCI